VPRVAASHLPGALGLGWRQPFGIHDHFNFAHGVTAICLVYSGSGGHGVRKVAMDRGGTGAGRPRTLGAWA